jgi:hypothetical protein
MKRNALFEKISPRFLAVAFAPPLVPLSIFYIVFDGFGRFNN